jgi:hypothetical protein
MLICSCLINNSWHLYRQNPTVNWNKWLQEKKFEYRKFSKKLNSKSASAHLIISLLYGKLKTLVQIRRESINVAKRRNQRIVPLSSWIWSFLHCRFVLILIFNDISINIWRKWLKTKFQIEKFYSYFFSRNEQKKKSINLFIQKICYSFL